MNNKLNEFLKITKKLNQKGITPLLMGSLGLEFVTQKIGIQEVGKLQMMKELMIGKLSYK